MANVIGIRAQNGIVVATTNRNPSLWSLLAPQTHLTPLGGRGLLASAGQAGVLQRAEYVAGSELRDGFDATGTPLGFTQRIARSFRGVIHASRMDLARSYGTLLAFHWRGEPHLCEFTSGHFEPILVADRPYAAIGTRSGVAIAYLSYISTVRWAGTPPGIGEAIFGACWVMRNTAPEVPIKVAAFQRWDGETLSARELTQHELQEHFEAAAAVDDELRRHVRTVLGKSALST